MLRVYYSNEEYEPDKHRILTTYSDRSPGAMPEDTSNVLANYSVIEIEERYNSHWDVLFTSVGRMALLGITDEFYINNSGQIVKSETGQVFNINPNPQKESYKLSQLYGLTHEQLDNIVDNISNLAEAKEFVRKLAHVVLWDVKHDRLDDSDLS